VDSVYYAGQTQPNVASLWSNGSASVTLAATAAGSALLASSTIATDALLGSITTS
jgi:hypothetical protein